MQKVVAAAVLFGSLFVLGCGGGGGGTPPPPPGGGAATITISNLTFNPSNLDVSPGTTVTVKNMDAFPHSVTSQTAQDQYTPGAVNGVSFDTGPFTGTATFTIPSNAPSGTVIPYYCSVHRNMMKNDGQITIK